MVKIPTGSKYQIQGLNMKIYWDGTFKFFRDIADSFKKAHIKTKNTNFAHVGTHMTLISTPMVHSNKGSYI